MLGRDCQGVQLYYHNIRQICGTCLCLSSSSSTSNPVLLCAQRRNFLHSNESIDHQFCIYDIALFALSSVFATSYSLVSSVTQRVTFFITLAAFAVIAGWVVFCLGGNVTIFQMSTLLWVEVACFLAQLLALSIFFAHANDVWFVLLRTGPSSHLAIL